MQERRESRQEFQSVKMLFCQEVSLFACTPSADEQRYHPKEDTHALLALLFHSFFFKYDRIQDTVACRKFPVTFGSSLAACYCPVHVFSMHFLLNKSLHLFQAPVASSANIIKSVIQDWEVISNEMRPMLM